MKPCFCLALFLGLSISFASAQQSFTDARDGQVYELVEVSGLQWFGSNLNFKTVQSRLFSDTVAKDSCHQFYNVTEAFQVCPKGWRLPTEAEVKRLLKDAKKMKFSVVDTLKINMCGRIDGDNAAKFGMQNTLWIDSPLENGSILHWHFFPDEIELHNHNVVNAKRKFPLRCVRAVR